VCHAVLQDPAFFHFLSRIDEEFASATRLGRCPGCGGPLHVADYPRKPRGCPAAVREDYSWRLSFTCGRCDARSTAPSVRFLGRRVYLAVVLMLFSRPGGSPGRELCELLSIPAGTLKRWRTWWQEDFACTPFWQSVRERFMPPVMTEQLPHSLLERFDGGAMADRLVQMLRWIAPLSNTRHGQVIRRPARTRRGCR
jgi:hypothetical protein